MAASTEELKKHVKIYWLVFAALAVLTVVTVSASHLQVGIALAVVIALIIAIVKGSLVASFFMHLFFDKNKYLHWLLILCAVFFAALMLLPVLTMLEMESTINVP